MSTSDREVARQLVESIYDRYVTAYRGEEEANAFKNAIAAALTTARREQAERDAVIVEGYKGDLAPPIVVRVAIAAAIRAGAKEGEQ